MTGEITLSGRVLPVGGIKEKLLAAKRAQMHTVLLPRANERDLKEIEPEIKQGLEIVKVTSVDDCLRRLF
jgi:ATP-dependent Lon protease